MSDERALLAGTVDRLLADLVGKDLQESAEQGRWPEALWRALEDSGLTLPLVDEARGGGGGSWEDAHVIVRAAGYHAAPVPLAETIVAGALLARAGLEVPPGPLTLGTSERLQVRRTGQGWRAAGAVPRVPWGRAARHLVVVVPDAADRALVASIDLAGARCHPDTNLALEPRDTLVLDAAPAEAAVAPDLDGEAVAVLGAIARSAQMAGALAAILAQATRYAGERRQFGRPIGAFQAIQHQLAVLAGQAAAADVAAAAAFRAATRSPLPRVEAAIAKIRAGEAAGVGAAVAHQVHGAIGFTYEHSLHFLTRRLWSWRAEFGGESHWAARLGAMVCARGADRLWADLTAGWGDLPSGRGG